MDKLVQLIGKMSDIALIHYTLSIDGVKYLSELSVLSLKAQETLNQPWCYDILFTANDKQLTADAILTQKARFTF
jgi:type VI secretion system secreted protein VgrG